MRLVNRIVLACATTALAASSAPDPNVLIDSIGAINTAVLALVENLKAWDGGINASIPITAAILQVHSVNRAGYAAAQNASPLNETASAQLVQFTQDSVGVSIPIAINITKTKKPKFDAALLSSLVECSLKLLLYDHQSFSLAVGVKLAPDQILGGLAVEEEIANAIESGITYFM